MWCIKQFSRLPFSWQIRLAKNVAPFAGLFLKRRMSITEINLTKCFPGMSQTEVKRLAKKCFESFLMGAVEAANSWYMTSDRFNEIKFTLNGREHIDEVKKTQTGFILCCFHFHTLEIVGRKMGEIFKGSGLVYQKHPNKKFDEFLVRVRSRYAAKIFRRKELKAMLRWLKQGGSFWYAPDQDFGLTPSVFAPFFGVQTATLTAPARMIKRTGAKLIPFFYHRVEDGYEITILPALENYPSGNEVQDATRLNQLFESHISQYPEQYLFQHRRFKTRPEGEESFY